MADVTKIRMVRDQHYPMVDDSVVESLEEYVYNRIPCGSFLNAVLCNDLKEACGRADLRNAMALHSIVGLIWNSVPRGAWGSYREVEGWLFW